MKKRYVIEVIEYRYRVEIIQLRYVIEFNSFTIDTMNFVLQKIVFVIDTI